jgi:hypothetical protein
MPRLRIAAPAVAVAAATGLLVMAAASTTGCIKKKEKTEKKTEAVVEKKKPGKPKIVALEDKFDFGKVKQGAVVEHVFKIANKGDAVLAIERAKGS